VGNKDGNKEEATNFRTRVPLTQQVQAQRFERATNFRNQGARKDVKGKGKPLRRILSFEACKRKEVEKRAPERSPCCRGEPSRETYLGKDILLGKI